MFRLTLVENEVLDLFDQQLLRFEERFHFESDAFEAFELTFLPSLFEHTMTLFRFSNHWSNGVVLFDCQHQLLCPTRALSSKHWSCSYDSFPSFGIILGKNSESVPARDKTIILF